MLARRLRRSLLIVVAVGLLLVLLFPTWFETAFWLLFFAVGLGARE